MCFYMCDGSFSFDRFAHAFYNFMNYADFGLGTWHPKGGMYQIVDGMVSLGKSLGVRYHTDHGVDEILLRNGKAR